MEERETIIHVGYHKSASTYLQQQIFPNLPINYVFVAGHRRYALDSLESRDQFAPSTVTDFVRSEIDKAESKHSITVLSHEELSGHPQGYDSIDPFAVAGNLKTAFPAAKILIIVRHQFEYLLSIYAYRVAIKGYETRSIKEFVEEEAELGLCSKLEYDRLVQHYVTLFGKERVLVLPVELLRSDLGRFYATLADFIGVDAELLLSLDSRPVNPSTRLQVVVNFWRPVNAVFSKLLDLLKTLQVKTDDKPPYRRVRYAYYGLKKRVTRILNRLFKPSDRLHIVIPDKWYSKYAESNRRLQALIDVDLETLGYPFEPN